MSYIRGESTPYRVLIVMICPLRLRVRYLQSHIYRLRDAPRPTERAAGATSPLALGPVGSLPVFGITTVCMYPISLVRNSLEAT